ncbi:MAG: response regulator transcription factor [Cyanobacteria bacterium P01_F01_bin.42]
MTTAAPIKILISEDHGIVREGIVAILQLQSDFAVVAQARNGLEAVALHRSHQPDITLMDLRMPNLEGVEAIREIRQHSPEAQIIILTTYDTDEDIYRGLQAGARGYLLKDADFEDLIDAVRTVHRGKRYIPPQVALKLADHLNASDLTEREYDVLQLLCKGNSNREIASALSVTEATVKYHINNILSKLDAKDRTQAVITAFKRGLTRLS